MYFLNIWTLIGYWEKDRIYLYKLILSNILFGWGENAGKEKEDWIFELQMFS